MKLLGVRHFRFYLTLPDHGKGCRLFYIKMHDYCKSIAPWATAPASECHGVALLPDRAHCGRKSTALGQDTLILEFQF